MSAIIPNRSHRRGVALLVVLAAIILTIPLVTALAQRAANTQAARNVDQSNMVAEDLLHAAHAPIMNWLEHESNTVVLPPDCETPEVPVLHDRIRLGNTDCEIHITAWDQCGMVPLNEARTSSLLSQTLPGEIRTLARSVDRRLMDSAPGLDLYVSTSKSGSSFASSPFPRAGSISAIIEFTNDWSGIWPSDSNRGGSFSDSQLLRSFGSSRTALGALVATHQNGKAASININTAPMPLVEAALRSAGRGGVEAIRNARSEGRLATAASLDKRTGSSRGPQIVSSSNVWSVRIDLRAGNVRRSWWEVYRQENKKWECVQRLVVTQ